MWPSCGSSSAQRVATDRGLRLPGGDIARVRETLVTKSVSLNEAERRAELAQDKARHAERERQERDLGASARPTTYAITLENVSSPGLPPPVAATAAKDTTVHPSPTDVDDLATGQSSADDVVLTEAERILADYVTLLTHHGALADREAK